MVLEQPAAEQGATGQLGAIAARLTDIAATVSREAEAATAVVRSLTVQAHEMAALAEALQDAANLMEAGVRMQADALASARKSLSKNQPAVEALAQSVENVASISGVVAKIARQSQILGINARIEASRTPSDGRAFAVVAQEMSTLANRTKAATDDIADRAVVIAQDIHAARAIVTSHGELVVTQDAILSAALGSATRHRDTAATLATITANTAGTIDQAATAMGRIGATAVAVKLLARQIAGLAA